MATKAYVGAPGGIKAGTASDYLNIGYYLDPTIQTKIEIVCTFENLSDTICIIGNHFTGSNSDQPNFSFYHTGAGVLAGVWWGYTFTTTKTIEINKTYTIEFDLMNGSQKMFVDGEQVYSNSYSGKIKNTSSFYLFARNQSGTITANMNTYIKSCKIWENNVLVRSLEVYQSSSIQKGLHDSVTDATYQMSSSSVLLQENKAREVKKIYVGVQDFLQSPGNNYIKTNIAPKNGTRLRMILSVDEFPQSVAYIYGDWYTGQYSVFIGITSDKKFQFAWANNEGTYSYGGYGSLIENKKYIIEAYWSSGNNYFKIDNVEMVTNTITNEKTDTTGSIYLFNRDANNSEGAKIKIYGCAIYQDDVLVADYIPRGKTFYDNVSKTSLNENSALIQGPEVAKRVYRAYVGYGTASNKAKIFWDNSGFYYTALGEILSPRDNYASVCDGEYLLIGGGSNSAGNAVTLVDAYNSSFVHTTPTALGAKRHRLAGATVGNYFLFAGGATSASSSSVASTVYSYKKSTLVRSTATSLSTARYWLDGNSVGNYALFAGGETSSGANSAIVNAYNSSLSRSTPTSLSIKRTWTGPCSNSAYAIFAGGNINDNNDHTNVVDAYNASNLTHSNLATLSEATQLGFTINTQDYAIHLSGTNWEYYDTSGVKRKISYSSNGVSANGTRGVYFKNHYFVCTAWGRTVTLNNNFVIDGRVNDITSPSPSILDLLGNEIIGFYLDNYSSTFGKIQ